VSAIFITAALSHRKGTTLGWALGHEAIDAMSNEAIIEAGKETGWYDNEIAEGMADEPHPLFDPEGDDAAVRMRSLAHDLFDDLRRDLTDFTEVSEHTVPGWHIFVTGGFSFGDAPTEAYEHFSQALEFLDVLKAIGFWVGEDE
jgi:hypothetical protein